MVISLIVAMDQNRGIGYKGRIPWRLSSDLKRFKALTLGHHVIMGRKTHQSIGKALPGRENLVVSRHSIQPAPGCRLVSSFELALDAARQTGEKETFVIGGAEIYALALPVAQRIYLTQVHVSVPADVYFPSVDADAWQMILLEEVPESAKDQYAYTYMILECIHG